MEKYAFTLTRDQVSLLGSIFDVAIKAAGLQTLNSDVLGLWEALQSGAEVPAEPSEGEATNG